jgi:DNA-binding transcriptional MerR regulator
MDKSADAFRTITEAAEELQLPQHVLRFWETRFPQIKPLKRAGGRRYYRPRDIEVLRAIKHLLYGEGYTIKGVQRILKEQGLEAAAASGQRQNEDSPGLSIAPEGVAPEFHQDGMTWVDESTGNATSDPISPERPLPVSPQAAEGDDAAAASEAPLWVLGLTAEDLARLRAALAELAQCEDILATVRRR